MLFIETIRAAGYLQIPSPAQPSQRLLHSWSFDEGKESTGNIQTDTGAPQKFFQKGKKEEFLQHLAALSLRNILCGYKRYWGRDTCYNPSLFSPFFSHSTSLFHSLSLSGYISLKRMLYPNTGLGIHMSPSSWRTQPWAWGILWNHTTSARSHTGSTGAAPIFHEVNVRQRFSVTGPEFQGTQNFLPCPQPFQPLLFHVFAILHHTTLKPLPAWVDFTFPPLLAKT